MECFFHFVLESSSSFRNFCRLHLEKGNVFSYHTCKVPLRILLPQHTFAGNGYSCIYAIELSRLTFRLIINFCFFCGKGISAVQKLTNRNCFHTLLMGRKVQSEYWHDVKPTANIYVLWFFHWIPLVPTTNIKSIVKNRELLQQIASICPSNFYKVEVSSCYL